MMSVAGHMAAGYGTSANPETDRMWAGLEAALERLAGVDAIFYLVFPVNGSAGAFETLLDRAVWRCTYPQTFRDDLPRGFLADDMSSQLVLLTRRPVLWHSDEATQAATPAQLKRLEINRRHGMAVGISIPVFNASGHVCGGFGLRHGAQDAAAFDEAWKRNRDGIMAELASFDQAYRGPFARHVFRLSPQELRVLAGAAAGMTASQAAHDLGLSQKTVEAYLRSARDKTLSVTTTEAVAKAVFFHLV
ncbi:MAG: autoinducer binding domain-containing protein [Notoacmeibacter sp.]|nr:autoinducer binding domain-containing protein [Notoacmeibacter sp.]MCC0032447.1 autoinducer binding domain-containing protein [Brucellaceae bacterium]